MTLMHNKWEYFRHWNGDILPPLWLEEIMVIFLLRNMNWRSHCTTWTPQDSPPSSGHHPLSDTHSFTCARIQYGTQFSYHVNQKFLYIVHIKQTFLIYYFSFYYYFIYCYVCISMYIFVYRYFMCLVCRCVAPVEFLFMVTCYRIHGYG